MEATWSPPKDGFKGKRVFQYLTGQVPWMGGCLCVCVGQLVSHSQNNNDEGYTVLMPINQ